MVAMLVIKEKGESDRRVVTVMMMMMMMTMMMVSDAQHESEATVVSHWRILQKCYGSTMYLSRCAGMTPSKPFCSSHLREKSRSA